MSQSTEEEKKGQDGKSSGSRQKNKRRNSKVDSNDGPEIPTGVKHQTSPYQNEERINHEHFFLVGHNKEM